jgi:hypothetical protein
MRRKSGGDPRQDRTAGYLGSSRKPLKTTIFHRLVQQKVVQLTENDSAEDQKRKHPADKIIDDKTGEDRSTSDVEKRRRADYKLQPAQIEFVHHFAAFFNSAWFSEVLGRVIKQLRRLQTHFFRALRAIHWKKAITKSAKRSKQKSCSVK